MILKKPKFIQVLKAPGYPCYAARKTIMEKWRSLPDYYRLISKHVVPVDDEAPEVYFLNLETVDDLIDQFMPEEARSNLAMRNVYLKTGRC